jgi:hypothetical protein
MGIKAEEVKCFLYVIQLAFDGTMSAFSVNKHSL